MSRYIDADALLSKGPFVVRMNDWGEYFVTVDEINKMPTVNAGPVVRCKDCKYCYADGFVNVRNVCGKHYEFGNVDDDWFCADGERRSDGK